MADVGNGAKAAIGIVSVIAIIGSLGGIMVGINRPMSQQLTHQSSELAVIRASMSQDDARELADVEKRGAMRVQFTEVETQFRGMSDKVAALQDLMDALDQRLQSEMDLRDQIIEARMQLYVEKQMNARGGS